MSNESSFVCLCGCLYGRNFYYIRVVSQFCVYSAQFKLRIIDKLRGDSFCISVTCSWSLKSHWIFILFRIMVRSDLVLCMLNATNVLRIESYVIEHMYSGHGLGLVFTYP